jgi:quinol monooxygenase YgiN
VVRAEVIRSRLGPERTEVLVGTITIFARMGVKPENVEKLKSLASDACKVAAEEPGTLTYDWHYSEEHGSLVLLETYAGSSAHLAHMQADGHGERMGSLMALIDSLEFFVLGQPTAEHAEALASVPGAQFYSELASK